MATSSTSSSNAINEGSQQYPYPSHVNAASFVSIKLSGWTNYVRWHEQMLCLLDSHDMLGFIDGTIKNPRENNDSKMKEDVTAIEAKYREWKRSDTLVKGWIYGSLNEDMMEDVVGLETSNDVWKELQKSYYTTLYALALAQTEPNPATASAPAPAALITSIPTRNKNEEEYVPLCRAIRAGDWEKAQEIFIADKDALTDKLNLYGHRSIHVAIGNPNNVRLLKNLLEQIDSELLPTLVNNNQQNGLHYAAILDNTSAAKMLVDKNPHLLFIFDKQNYLPIHKAVFESHKTTLLYLLQVCKQYIGLSQTNDYHNPFEGENGVLLLTGSIMAGFLDVAYALLKDYPKLACTMIPKLLSPLSCIAQAWDAYPSSKRYNFYQRFIYSHVPTKNPTIDDTSKTPDIENQETYRGNLVTNCMKSYIYPVPCIKHLHEEKVKHNTATTILQFICEEVCKLTSNHREHYCDAFYLAVKNNTPEVIEHITRTFPGSIWTNDLNGYTISQLSILYRCDKVYNFLVHEVTHDRHMHQANVYKDGNNLLHLAGQLAPIDKLNMVTGAALQMQRELQWFKEVRKIMRPKEREAKNDKQETPIMVFRKEHSELRKNGEEWMKKTADSYTITAALIITIVFAAAITVPGGNNGDTGKAIYETRPSFIVFVVSDAISLFTSTTSLLLFLSILTARYAEEDFLYKLPNRLILGLVMLFMSVTTMMIAFSATLYIMFGQEMSWIVIPIAALTCLPIASFLTSQLPLLVDLASSTYGQGIFGKLTS